MGVGSPECGPSFLLLPGGGDLAPHHMFNPAPPAKPLKPNWGGVCPSPVGSSRCREAICVGGKKVRREREVGVVSKGQDDGCLYRGSWGPSPQTSCSKNGSRLCKGPGQGFERGTYTQGGVRGVDHHSGVLQVQNVVLV